MAIATSHHPYLRHSFDAKKPVARLYLPSSSRTKVPTVDWVIIDRRVVVLDPNHFNLLTPSAREAAEEAATPIGASGETRLCFTTFASAATADGGEVYLHLCCPPALSLALLIDEGAVARPEWRKPSVLAADAGRLLLRVPSSTATELLLFDASKPSLVALPPRPYSSLFQARGTGFLSQGDDYVVAFIQAQCIVSDSKSEVASIAMFSSMSSTWTTMELGMPSMPPGVGTNAWRLDSSVSYRNCISWVDFSRGVITCDVLEQQPVLYFLSLPTVADISEINWMYNSLCVSNGMLRFLCVKPRSNHGGATITVYTLDAHGYCWNDEGGVLLTCGPQVPQSPILSGEDPDILHFLLKQDGLKYVHAINWKTCRFLGKFLYVEEISRGAPIDTPFLGSEISLHVADPPEMIIGLEDGGNGGYEIQALVPQPRLGRIKASKVD